jgi:hypothetical protein
MRPGGKVLVAEPKGHVSDAKFRESMQAASLQGFRAADGPVISGSPTAVLQNITADGRR